MEIQTGKIVGYQEQGSYSQPARQVEGIATEGSPEQQSSQAQPVQVAKVQPQTDADGQKRKDEEDITERERDRVKEAVKEINKSANGTEAIFGIHEKTNRVTIKIVDKETKEVVREVPAEKTLDLIAKAWEMAGILVDEKR